jgi:hypothetical protein
MMTMCSVSTVSAGMCVSTMTMAVAVPAVREPADCHEAKSHGTSRQRDEIEIHED